MTSVRNRHFLLLDLLFLPLCTLLALLIRFEGWSWTSDFGRIALIYALAAVPAKLVVLWLLGLYRRLWRHASVADLERIAVAALVCGAVGLLLGGLVLPWLGLIPARMPLSVLLIEALLTPAAIMFPRVFARLSWRQRRAVWNGESERALIVGAGAAGGLIAREMRENERLHLLPVGFVDDDPAKQNLTLQGVPILGAITELGQLVADHRIDKVVIAMPTAPGSVVRAVVERAREAGVPTRTVPSITEILTGKRPVLGLRDIQIEDLLRRDPVAIDLDNVRPMAEGRTVLVTGAGGSIGSELCRQLARLGPSRLLALGHGENSIFELVQDLGSRFPEVYVEPLIVDVRDRARMASVFDRHRPYSVFHAAAHKHVPLMERHPWEAVTNNVIGTQNAAELAAEFDASHFVLISTDKAVRPTSVMGATKRIAEQVTQVVAEQTGKHFVSVRFGNVLGSRGSVVPTFLKQIHDGGPVTVTHPEMRRYFMTIPEAVQLVLQAAVLGRGGEVFVLDMGEAIRIADLASDLIRLSGHEPGRDIEIQFTGCREGEKLYEEPLFGSEMVLPTDHPKVLRVRNPALAPEAQGWIADLIALSATDASEVDFRALAGRLVPDYTGAVIERVARAG